MATMLHEYDTVELVTLIAAERIWFPDLYGDPWGDQGAVVDVHSYRTAAIEFMRGERIIALVDVHPNDVRVLTANLTATASVGHCQRLTSAVRSVGVVSAGGNVQNTIQHGKGGTLIVETGKETANTGKSGAS